MMRLLHSTKFTILLACLGVSLEAGAQGFYADEKTADFAQGTFTSNVMPTTNGLGDGAVQLTGVLNDQFSSFSTGGAWNGVAWTAGGAASLIAIPGGSALSLDAYHLYSSASFGPGSIIQFRARFSADNFQNVGFGSPTDFQEPFASIGRSSTATGSNLYARFDDASGGAAPIEVVLSSTAAGDGNFHDYKIVWGATGFDFYIDGGSKQTITFTLGGTMQFRASDFTLGGGATDIDWVDVAPNYNTTGSYLSRVFDSGDPSHFWGTVNWYVEAGAGSVFKIFVSTGNTAIPDGSWTAFTEVTNNQNINTQAQYLRYRADFTSTGGNSPVFDQIYFLWALTPVTLTDLSASANGSNVKLNWATASESNNKGFGVYRSNDGVKWAPIGFVAGAGSSSLKQSYSYNDGNLADGKYFYRLRQEDFDGKSVFSNIVSVKVSRTSTFTLAQNYPNPASFSTMINYSVPSNARVRITLYDATGRLVKVVEDAQRKAGNYSVMVDASRMKSGLYYYKIEADGQTMTKKMAIQN